MFNKRGPFVLNLIILFSFLSLNVFAQGILQDTLGNVFSGLNIGQFYQQNSLFVDAVIYFIIFIGIAYHTLGEKFGSGGKAITIGVGLALSFGMTYYAYSTGFFLGKLGPYVVLVLVLLVMYVFYWLIRTLFHAANAFAIGACYFIGYFLTLSLIPDFVNNPLFGWFGLGMLVSVVLLVWGIILWLRNVLGGGRPLGEGSGSSLGRPVFGGGGRRPSLAPPGRGGRDDIEPGAGIAEREFQFEEQVSAELQNIRNYLESLERAVHDQEYGILPDTYFQTENYRQFETAIQDAIQRVGEITKLNEQEQRLVNLESRRIAIPNEIMEDWRRAIERIRNDENLVQNDLRKTLELVRQRAVRGAIQQVDDAIRRERDAVNATQQLRRLVEQELQRLDREAEQS